MNCQVAKEGRVIDLSSLQDPKGFTGVTSSGTGNDVDDIKPTSFYLNVCHTLGSAATSTGCPPSAAACKVEKGKPAQVFFQLNIFLVIKCRIEMVHLRYKNYEIMHTKKLLTRLK